MAVTENVFLPIGDPGGPASGQTDFTFTFEYLNKDTDIKVSLDGVNTSAYTFPTGSVVRFNTAPANGVVVRIYRDTDIDTARAVFAPGSVIRSQDLNDNFDQIRFVVQETDNNSWDNEVDTVKSTNTWVSSDEKVATTAAIDARFQDEIGDTLISSETWVSSDDYIATTRSIDQRIDTAITNDIGTDGTGITVTDDGDGTITLGVAANSLDLDRIKDEDIITYAEQEAGSPSWLTDTRIPTTFAAARRFDTLVQTATPTGSSWAVGKTWLQNDQDLTLSVWNGSNWLGIASGGTFTNQPKVVYVDASSGNDANDGHRISRPKATIKAALTQINADAVYGDGSVVVVAPGTYQEVAPLDITKKDVSIIGTALRSCIIHPTQATETNSLFRVNSGTFLQNLTFTGVKASGTRGEAGSVDPDAVYGLPGTQGWNVSFYPGAMIYKSPYIQNCTNFSDSEINNSSLNPHTPAGGSAGDTDSSMTGGGLLVDGSTVDSTSPLRSMVCDSYTHVGLDGPGILVTNNGYAQCTSSYAFFNQYHIKCLNGGQANLAASTTDFGRYALIADGRSTSAIFTATTTVDAADGDLTFTIDAPVTGAPWHGSATRPQSNMLVDIGGNTYPILSATPNGSGWDVVISRPNPANRANNLGLNGAVLTGAAVSFYLRSMIASSGHTMEYVGSGTNYSALPENGGVPVEANQVVELNNGKIWTATTDHNGKFKVGDFFTVDQQSSAVYVSTGSYAVSLQTLATNNSGNAQIGANLDLNGSQILDSTGNVTIADILSMNTNRIINVADPVSNQDAVTKNYVDSNFLGTTPTGEIGFAAGSATQPGLYVTTDTNTGVFSPGADELALATGGSARLTIDSAGAVAIPGTASVGGQAVVVDNDARLTDTRTPTDGSVTNAKVAAAAAIAGTKISPNFGSQNITTTGTVTVGAITIPNTDGTNGQVLTTNGSGTLSFTTVAAGGGASVTTSDVAPSSPSDGDLWYDSVGGRLYVYYDDGNTSQWVDAAPQGGGGGASVTVSETAPTSPTAGDLWFDNTTTDARLYIYYDDGNTQQWIDAAPAGAGGGVSGVVSLDGITFPATQVASADPNTLDDYEEGTWTPALKFGGNSVSMTGSYAGKYVKIGKVVYYSASISLTAKGSSTGNTTITGLPFTNASGGNENYATTIAFMYNGASLTGPLMPRVGIGSTTIDVFQNGATGYATVSQANFNNTSQVQIFGFYFV
jgi:hypothetical protein